MAGKILRTLLVAGDIGLLCSGTAYLACRARPPLEDRIEQWRRMEYGRTESGKCEDGLSPALDAYFEAMSRGDTKSASRLKEVCDQMLENRDNLKRQNYCRERAKAAE